MNLQININQDFDLVRDRRNTFSTKYDFSGYGKPENVLPLWVADMDFSSPQCVIEALVKHSRHGVFGYSKAYGSYFETIQNWFLRRHGWKPEKNWHIASPGVTNAIYTAIRALTEEGDGVLIQEPVYHNFASTIQSAERKTVVNELVYTNNKYTIDFDDFEEKIEDGNVRLFLLCNPHNPVGRVWTQNELLRMGDICLQHGVTVISDEIHQDFVFDGHKHYVFDAISPKFRDMTITCTAPTKTFNLSGLMVSNIFIANTAIRRKFLSELSRLGLPSRSVMGMVACNAAYEGGEAWLDELNEYLSGNFGFVREFLSENIPQVKLVEAEGTYLAWLDFRELDISDEELNDLILSKGRLWLVDGPTFGTGGEGFQRMNIACPRIVLWEALKRLDGAVRSQLR